MSYSIGEVAKMLGLSTYAIRYYDQAGLLPFVKRDKHGNGRSTERFFMQPLFILFLLLGAWPGRDIASAAR